MNLDERLKRIEQILFSELPEIYPIIVSANESNEDALKRFKKSHPTKNDNFIFIKIKSERDEFR